jgi:hypothetical protein
MKTSEFQFCFIFTLHIPEHNQSSLKMAFQLLIFQRSNDYQLNQTKLRHSIPEIDVTQYQAISSSRSSTIRSTESARNTMHDLDATKYKSISAIGKPQNAGQDVY